MTMERRVPITYKVYTQFLICRCRINHPYNTRIYIGVIFVFGFLERNILAMAQLKDLRNCTAIGNYWLVCSVDLTQQY